MASEYGHKTVKSKLNEEFSEQSEWNSTYIAMLNGQESQLVNWTRAIDIQQGVVDSLERTSSGSSFCLADLLTVQPDSADDMGNEG